MAGHRKFLFTILEPPVAAKRGLMLGDNSNEQQPDNYPKGTKPQTIWMGTNYMINADRMADLESPAAITRNSAGLELLQSAEGAEEKIAALIAVVTAMLKNEAESMEVHELDTDRVAGQ